MEIEIGMGHRHNGLWGERGNRLLSLSSTRSLASTVGPTLFETQDVI